MKRSKGGREGNVRFSSAPVWLVSCSWGWGGPLLAAAAAAAAVGMAAGGEQAQQAAAALGRRVWPLARAYLCSGLPEETCRVLVVVGSLTSAWVAVAALLLLWAALLPRRHPKQRQGLGRVRGTGMGRVCKDRCGAAGRPFILYLRFAGPCRRRRHPRRPPRPWRRLAAGGCRDTW